VELEFDSSKWIAVKMNAEMRTEISIALESYISAGILFPEETRLVENILKEIRNERVSEVSVPLMVITQEMVTVN
jgi:hypothetical protein